MPIKMIIIIYSYTKNINLVTEFVKKCNGKENGRYSFKKYKEGISELTWLYYLIIGVMKTNQIKVVNVYDEEHILLDNQSKFEYTFSIENPKCLIAFEVKSLSCDPFDKEKITIPPIDGQKIVKPFFPALKESDYLRNQSDTIVLNSSTHYNQIVSNINRINKKCNGKNISGSDLFFFGTMFITSSTSFEEFYSYFFNEEYGLYDMLKRSNIDALFLASLDAKNDLYLDNLYYNKYIQTIHVVELYLTTEVSYRELALSVGINNPSIVTKWVNDYRIVGADALRPKRKGRKPQVAKPKKEQLPQTEKEKADAEYLRQLEEENLRLRIENAYLKELRRLRLEDEAKNGKRG